MRCSQGCTCVGQHERINRRSRHKNIHISILVRHSSMNCLQNYTSNYKDRITMVIEIDKIILTWRRTKSIFRQSTKPQGAIVETRAKFNSYFSLEFSQKPTLDHHYAILHFARREMTIRSLKSLISACSRGTLNFIQAITIQSRAKNRYCSSHRQFF